MNPTTAGFIVAMVELILKYGVPGAVAVLKEWEVENPTLEDIQALKGKVPKPETYFTED